METEAKPQELTEQRWVYTGLRHGAKGELHDVYAPCGKDGSTSDQRLNYSAAKSRRVVGGIYRVTATADGSRARLSSAQFDSRYQDANAVAEWRAQTDALLVQERAKATERRVKKEQLEALAPLAALWRKSVGHDRLALELVVLNYLRTGGHK